MTISEATDQVFKGVSGDVVIDDAGNSKKLTVSNTGGWTDTVIWNPYGDAGKRGGFFFLFCFLFCRTANPIFSSIHVVDHIAV